MRSQLEMIKNKFRPEDFDNMIDNANAFRNNDGYIVVIGVGDGIDARNDMSGMTGTPTNQIHDGYLFQSDGEDIDRIFQTIFRDNCV